MEIALEFEKPILALEQKRQELLALQEKNQLNLRAEIEALDAEIQKKTQEIFSNLTPWQRVQLARHPGRPHVEDLIPILFPNFLELHGDRTFGDDRAIIGGIARIGNQSVVVIGQAKGRTTKEKMDRNFGMPRPEGYRKAMRLMRMAERFRLPIFTWVDTPGAYPGIDAEERGQAQSIAESIQTLFAVKTPVVTIIVGEGGSGGALALAAGDWVLMLEHSVYSVISPESCAAILWNNSALAEKAAERLKLTSKDLLNLGAIDGIIPEPQGGAHRDWPATFKILEETIATALHQFKNQDMDILRQRRRDKFRKIGVSTLEISPSESEPAGIDP